MPPKAANKGSAKKPNTAVANKNWETGLTKDPFEEVCWPPYLLFLLNYRFKHFSFYY